MIFSHFIKKIGEPVSREFLLRYIIFCKEKLIKEENINDYKKVERHHILPRSFFKEFLKDTWNIVPLVYEDHIEAHKLLVKAYPIRKFIRPLNYMLNYDKPEEFKKMKSEEVKEWWKQFKKTNGYKIWREKRKNNTNNFENFRNAGIIKRKELNKNEVFLNELSKKCKSFYDSEENRRKHSEDIKKGMTQEVKNKISKNSQEMWNNRDDDFIKMFSQKMKEINAKPDIKKINSEKNKKKWESIEYREKMKEARKKGKKRNIQSQSNKMKEKWSDPNFRQMMLEKRKRK